MCKNQMVQKASAKKSLQFMQMAEEKAHTTAMEIKSCEMVISNLKNEKSFLEKYSNDFQGVSTVHKMIFRFEKQLRTAKRSLMFQKVLTENIINFN